MKKCLSLLLVISIVFSLALSFTSCKDKTEETEITGAVETNPDTGLETEEEKETDKAETKDTEDTKETEDTEETTKAPVINAEVKDDIVFEKEVVDMFNPDNSALSFTTHRIRTPKLSYASDNAMEFNKKLSKNGEEAYKTLKAGKEENVLYDYNYKANIAKEKVSIVLIQFIGYQYSEGYSSYQGYYYDLHKDCEISLEEYLTAIGYTEGDILNEVKITENYKNSTSGLSEDEYDFSSLSITAITVGEDGAFISLNLPYLYDEQYSLDFSLYATSIKVK